MSSSRVSVAIASVALAVGLLSAGGGVLEQRAAHTQVCQASAATNAEFRSFLHDLLATPKVDNGSRVLIERQALTHFPVKTC
jgi:hypothetical protein